MSTDTTTPEGERRESFEWMLSVDDRLLTHFNEHGPCLCPQAASVLGLHVSFAHERCETLRNHGLLSENESQFGLTDRGRQYLDVSD